MSFANTDRDVQSFTLIEALAVIAVAGLLGGCSRSGGQAVPERASAVPPEPNPVMVSSVAMDRLAGEVVCIYNFSSW